MSPYVSVLEIVLLSLSIARCFATIIVYTVNAARRRQLQVNDQLQLPPAAIADVGDSAITILSGRLAAIEGRMGPIVASLDSVALLQQRLAALEVNMPSMQEAMEKYADQIARTDKRDTERARRTATEEAKTQTAGDAAADLMGGAGAGGNAPADTAGAAPTSTRAGVLGQGGRRRR